MLVAIDTYRRARVTSLNHVVEVEVFDIGLNDIGVFEQNWAGTNAFFDRPRVPLVRIGRWS